MKQNRKKIKPVFAIILAVVMMVGVVTFFAACWYIRVFGDVGFTAILSTLTAGIGGTGSDLINSFMLEAFVPAIILTIVLALFLFSSPRQWLVAHIGEKIKFRLYPFPRALSVILSLALSVIFVFFSAVKVGFFEYIDAISNPSTIFEDYYINPTQVEIEFPEKKQNLIYIFLESMETSFLPQDLGGGNTVNPIPELYNLAEKNVNFSQNGGVGGLYSLASSAWTVSAMVTQTSGAPLKSPMGASPNEYGQDTFLPGMTTLSDILNKEGYYQALMVGSDASFGSRKQYYEQHGVDKIYDLYTAQEDGVVPEDYFVWWGIEDSKLFGWARQELLKISKQDKPFAFTLLTVDTHHVDGYKCELCPNDYDEQYENVLACSSKQVSKFIEWVQKQDFYKDTAIVICGDHPTMDARYVLDNISSEYRRTLYNSFINSKATPIEAKNRIATSVDMMPTTLASIGCKIEGDRLGLGTNLFSNKETMGERIGLDEFNNELLRYSAYYNNNFIK